MKKIREEIYKKYYSRQADVKVSDLPPDLQPDDIIDIDYVEAHYSENESWDEHTYLRIYRERYETEREKTERLQKFEDFKTMTEKLRYSEYLKLKAIYENENN
tara:strand:- start:742 stop:1050 length:309 start_codon:yes stop_codon:yes gene_type:complete